MVHPYPAGSSRTDGNVAVVHSQCGIISAPGPLDLDANQVGWLTTVVQVCFVVGTACAAVLNLADVYPPAMNMIATWFKTSRGFAIGTIVGALTIGKATPYLVRAFNSTDWR